MDPTATSAATRMRGASRERMGVVQGMDRSPMNVASRGETHDYRATAGWGAARDIPA